MLQKGAVMQPDVSPGRKGSAARLRCVAAQPRQSDADPATHLQLGLQSRSVLHQFFAAFFLGLIPIARLGRTLSSCCYFGSPNPDFDKYHRWSDGMTLRLEQAVSTRQYNLIVLSGITFLW
jgi:hypothetical protein